MDFTPDLHIEDVKSILSQHKNRFVVITVLCFVLVICSAGSGNGFPIRLPGWFSDNSW